MKIKFFPSYFFRFILAVWSIYSFYDGFSVNNWYELTAVYFVTVFPFTLILFLVSIRDIKYTGFKKIIGWGGLLVSSGTFLAEIVHLIFVFLLYY